MYRTARITGTGLITSQRAKLFAVMATPGGSEDFEIKLYNATGEEGDPVFHAKAIAATDTLFFSFARPFICSSGLYAVAEGQGGSAIISYY